MCCGTSSEAAREPARRLLLLGQSRKNTCKIVLVTYYPIIKKRGTNHENAIFLILSGVRDPEIK